MLRIQTVTVVLFEVFVGLLRRQSMEGEFYAAGIIGVSAKDTFDGRIAAEHTSTSVLVFLIDAHHFESDVTYINEVTHTTFQLLRLFIA